MLKSELLDKLRKQGRNNDVIVIGDYECGWCNVADVKFEDGMISIMTDYEMPFSDDK